VLFNASDAIGVRVTDLEREDFIAKLGKQPLNISSVESVHLAPRVIILIDTSGSMQESEEAPAVAMTMASAIFSLL
jgi:uncharacterized protein with von Willebrand factor type A (vWA) domain